MCWHCYYQAGSPMPNNTARVVGQRLEEIEPTGSLHVVIDDWNVEDEHIDAALAADLLPSERAIMRVFKALPLDQRYAALAVAEGIVE